MKIKCIKEVTYFSIESGRDEVCFKKGVIYNIKELEGEVVTVDEQGSIFVIAGEIDYLDHFEKQE